MGWKLGAAIVLACAQTACGSSFGVAYERAFASGARAQHAGRYEEAARAYEHPVPLSFGPPATLATCARPMRHACVAGRRAALGRACEAARKRHQVRTRRP